MDGSPSSILMVGFGNGTFNGSPSLILTLGFGMGADNPVTLVGIWGDVEHIAADRTRTTIKANRIRTAAHADRERIEVKG